MKNWEAMEAFVEVVRQGSFSAAAIKLSVSASHISRLVTQLESELGSTLLFRTTRRIRLSEAGELYYQHCRGLPAALSSAEEVISSLNQAPIGSFKMTCATTFGERYIAPVMNDFLTTHPKIELDLHLTNRAVDLIEENYDLAIRMGAMKDSSLLSRRLCDRQEFLCASREYIDQYGMPHTLSELNKHKCLIGSKNHWLFQQNGQRKEVKVSSQWRSNSGLALLDAVKKGLGIAQLPDYYVRKEFDSGRLVPLLSQYQYPYSGVWLVYPKSQTPSPKLKAVCDFLIHRFEHDKILDIST
ncbi:LysR family transcriptional regulator [Marinomonas mediterranea]|jgi:transcriptional regulator, LysR family|uniref:Transcriptional regulator, LysR family n=1 Tax=Marinomonas mediterranea (strain ATCC 700492 / JCM 21426 / NBRC 103028 / MMB-1) TaxID=717774 RepID=F2K4X0_MARM1|nr:LysR family transcriptional regulator [Marinomonas mediterranea]ADZ92613.1 transcriptional regulator, LysR family [Marinomonas mediterranea MMB-1]WCN10554.1 LysR family transcriptional regulator [Marinomonas mediterranea]WCN14603.1 LysR family transcriptional regulator [Marinomonas mediterranea]WCN18651.1 LysR family transcriptional regulator [Marinomonas mediterranea MMB-1]